MVLRRSTIRSDTMSAIKSCARSLHACLAHFAMLTRLHVCAVTSSHSSCRTDGTGATVAARKFLRALKQPVVINNRSLVVTGSVGISWSPEHATTAEILLQKADIAMYAAKN